MAVKTLLYQKVFFFCYCKDPLMQFFYQFFLLHIVMQCFCRPNFSVATNQKKLLQCQYFKQQQNVLRYVLITLAVYNLLKIVYYLKFIGRVHRLLVIIGVMTGLKIMILITPSFRLPKKNLATYLKKTRKIHFDWKGWDVTLI